MNNNFKIFPLVLLAFIQIAYSQGTGDTNISLFGNISPSFKSDGEADFMRATVFTRYDRGKNEVVSISPMIRLEFIVNDQIDLQVLLTSKQASGPLGSGFSFGDLSFANTCHLNYDHASDDYDPSIDFGFMLTTTGGRKLYKRRDENFIMAYPMEYQSTLGTVDVYLGYTIKTGAFNFSVGYQHPLLKQNFNNFFPKYFNLGDKNENYPPSNEMSRSGDVYSRIGFNVKSNENFFLNLGFTGFYRVSDSRFFMNNKSDKVYARGFHTVPDTNGMALNAVFQTSFRLSYSAQISLYAGLPLVHRKETIDGLRRDYFITPSLTWFF